MIFGLLVGAALRNRLFVLAAAAVLVVLGSITLPRLPVDGPYPPVDVQRTPVAQPPAPPVTAIRRMPTPPEALAVLARTFPPSMTAGCTMAAPGHA